MIIIGEKINGTRKGVAQAIESRDAAYIEALARRQAEAGADYLDINAGTHPDREPDDLAWLVHTVQGITDVRLCLDSANPLALSAGIEAADRTPMINSLSGEKARIEGILPLACAHGTEIVVLAMDDRGIPKNSVDRLNIVRGLVERARREGLPDGHLYIDPLVTTISTDLESGRITLETMRLVKKEFPGVHLTAGVSNVSFGLPARSVINRAFAAMAMACGLDSVIINPEDREIMGALYAAEMLLGKDAYCLNFIKAYRSGLIAPSGEAKK